MIDADNRLIACLPRRDRAALFAAGDIVALPNERVLAQPGGITRHVYFPADCTISLLTAAVSGHAGGLEVGLVGHEGMLGVQLVLGIQAVPLLALVQRAGAACCVPAEGFRELLAASAALRRLMQAYVQVLMSQQVTAVACMAFHQVEQRLARRLLMAHDRASQASFHLTHEMLGQMLGVRRVGITGAARSLQRQGLIRYHRGEITVVDRPGLEAAACSCHATDLRTYASMMAGALPLRGQ